MEEQTDPFLYFVVVPMLGILSFSSLVPILGIIGINTKLKKKRSMLIKRKFVK